MYIPILAYHKIDDQFEWGINTVSPRRFENQIKFLADNGFSSICLSDYIADREKDAKKIIITFDDSYKSIYNYAYPLLNKYGFTATVFIISEFIGKKNLWDINLGGKTCWHLDWDEIAQLIDAGWEIGSHSATHPDLTRISHQELLYELVSSKHKLEQRLATSVNFISYPFNRFNISVIEAVQENGYKGGCCLASVNSISSKFYHFTIPRMGVYSIDDFFWFKLKLKYKNISKIDGIKQKIICLCANGSVYYNQVKKIKKNLAI